MKIVKLILTGLLCTGVFVACSDDDDNDNLNPGLSAMDQLFVQKAAFGNKAEIDAGQLASTQGSESMVKMFGTMMVSDHQTAYNELAGLTSNWSISIPQTPDSVHIAKKQYLMTLSGHTFDTAYMMSQVKDHHETVDLFQMEADSSKQQQLKDYANKYLPAIKMHLHLADSIVATF
jgi:putative membrane protein